MEFFFTIIIVSVLLSFVLGGFSLAPWVPTRKRDLLRIDRLADLRAGQKFYELGCGDARVSHYIAQQNPQAHIIGYELTWIMYLVAKIRLFFSPLPNLLVYRRDIFSEDLSEANVLYVFGMKESVGKKLKEKLQNAPKKGRRLISYNFRIENAVCAQKDTSDNEIGIYLYQM